MHIARFYLSLELRGAAHARLVAPSLAIPLRACLSVGRSVGGSVGRAVGRAVGPSFCCCDRYAKRSGVAIPKPKLKPKDPERLKAGPKDTAVDDVIQQTFTGA